MALQNKRVIFFLGILFIFLSLLFFKKSEQKQQNYNIILISIDALGANHMGIYGYKKDTVPNIDTWSKNAYVFANTVVNTPWTHPSLVGFMTGQHMLTNKIINIKELLSNNTVTLAKILKKYNYKNYAFVTNPFLAPPLSNFNMSILI